jgi:folate-binding protein YgfZ
MIACDIELFFTTVVSITMLNTSQSPHQTALLKFSGEDASSFLQGQLTNDINALECNWQYSGYCSPKGRLLALLIMWKHDNELFALLPASLVEPTIKRLRMYVMRSKVTIDVIEQISVSQIYTSSEPRFKYQHATDLHSLSFGGRDLIVATKADTTSDTLTPKWVMRNIEDGLPEITDKTSELFVPQMINLDLLGGINFKKGCYTGQEIVARMHYLGKLKQRMFVCTIADLNSEPEYHYQAGAKVMHDDKNVGHIVSNEGDLALAVLRTEFVSQENKGGINIESSEGKKIGLSINEAQPYSLELKS